MLFLVCGTFISCNLKILARPNIQKENEERKEANKLVEEVDKNTLRMLDLKGEWTSEDGNIIIKFNGAMEYEYSNVADESVKSGMYLFNTLENEITLLCTSDEDSGNIVLHGEKKDDVIKITQGDIIFNQSN